MKTKPKINQTLDNLLKKQPDYFSFDMLKAELEASKVNVANSTLKTYMSRLVSDEKVFDAGKGWYSTIENTFNLNVDSLKEIIEIINKSFPLLQVSCWNTEQINPFTHHMLGKHILFVYVDADAVNSVHEKLLDKGYHSYANPGKPEIEKSFRLIEKTVVIRPSIAKQPKDINNTAPIEKILVDLLFENRKLNIMAPMDAQQVLQNAIKSGRISISAMVSYSKRRGINLLLKNQSFPDN